MKIMSRLDDIQAEGEEIEVGVEPVMQRGKVGPEADVLASWWGEG